MKNLKNTNSDCKSAEDLIYTFAACSNFPKDRAGITALAEALTRAAKDFGFPMQQIVQQCADISTYCPVPRELRNVALSMRDEARRKREGNRDAEWRRIYGDPEPDWPAQLIGILTSAGDAEQIRACHIRAVRDMLFYTEGDGAKLGDREFWEKQARPFELSHHPELIRQVRAAGGWQAERELQMDWIEVPWQPSVPSTDRKRFRL